MIAREGQGDKGNCSDSEDNTDSYREIEGEGGSGSDIEDITHS